MSTTTTQIDERPRVIVPRAGRGSEIFAILLLAAGAYKALGPKVGTAATSAGGEL